MPLLPQMATSPVLASGIPCLGEQQPKQEKGEMFVVLGSQTWQIRLVRGIRRAEI